MTREDWENLAQAGSGTEVVWINQGSDPQLLAQNSGGVCAAITRTWIEANRQTALDRTEFVDSFLHAQTGQNPTNLPSVYIQRQARMAAEYRVTRDVMQDIDQRLASPTISAADRDHYERTYISLGNRQFGPNVETVTRKRFTMLFDYSDIVELINKAADTTSVLYILSVIKKGRGHVIGFSCRPDISLNAAFPRVYEFFDANLGIYAFPTVEEMTEFSSSAWVTLYQHEAYTHLALAKFNPAEN